MQTELREQHMRGQNINEVIRSNKQLDRYAKPVQRPTTVTTETTSRLTVCFTFRNYYYYQSYYYHLSPRFNVWELAIKPTTYQFDMKAEARNSQQKNIYKMKLI